MLHDVAQRRECWPIDMVEVTVALSYSTEIGWSPPTHPLAEPMPEYHWERSAAS